MPCAGWTAARPRRPCFEEAGLRGPRDACRGGRRFPLQPKRVRVTDICAFRQRKEHGMSDHRHPRRRRRRCRLYSAWPPTATFGCVRSSAMNSRPAIIVGRTVSPRALATARHIPAFLRAHALGLHQRPSSKPSASWKPPWRSSDSNGRPPRAGFPGQP